MPDDDATETTSDDVADATGVPADEGDDDDGDAPTASDETPDGGEATSKDASDDADDSDGEGQSDGEGDSPKSADAADASAGDEEPAKPGEYDFDAAEARLEGVEEKIEEGKKALADVEQDIEPDPDGQPVAESDDAAKAPPG